MSPDHLTITILSVCYDEARKKAVNVSLHSPFKGPIADNSYLSSLSRFLSYLNTLLTGLWSWFKWWVVVSIKTTIVWSLNSMILDSKEKYFISWQLLSAVNLLNTGWHLLSKKSGKIHVIQIVTTFIYCKYAYI
jgi:hypothetical protein